MSSRTYYIEYHDADRLHPFGYRLPVEEDVVLLGRDPSAGVRFYDDTPTVSRRHALIRRHEGQYIIEPLSQTNSTLVNGQRIFRPTILRSGDEIRLSTDGPRLGVIFPRQDAAAGGVSAVGVNDGGSRVARQLLLWLSVAVVAVALGLGIWKITDLYSANRRLDEIEAARLDKQPDPAAVTATEAATPQSETPSGNPYSAPATADDTGGGAWDIQLSPPGDPSASGSPSEAAMKVADKSVYYVMALGFEVTTPDGRHYEIECGNGEGQIPGWSGTGFLLSDGRFVTARHVVEPWFFIDGSGIDDEMLSLNMLASNGGKVVAYIGAVSPTGDRIMFKSSECRVDRSGDQRKRTRSGEIVRVAPTGARDFATVASGRSGGLPFSPETSRNLRRGTKLTVLSFPLGLGANSYNDINPVYGAATVAADGLQEGMILTTETAYEKGSSGGPVFVTDSSGRLVVVGITSAIAGRSTGFIEPISSIR